MEAPTGFEPVVRGYGPNLLGREAPSTRVGSRRQNHPLERPGGNRASRRSTILDGRAESQRIPLTGFLPLQKPEQEGHVTTDRPERIRATLMVGDLRVSAEEAPPDVVDIESWATEDEEGEFKDTIKTYLGETPVVLWQSSAPVEANDK